MTIYAAFAEMDGLYLGPTSSPTGVPVDRTSAAESGVSRSGFYAESGYLTHRLGANLSEFWVHIRLIRGFPTISGLLQIAQTGTSQVLLSLVADTSYSLAFVLPVIGQTSYPIVSTVLIVNIDLHIKIGETGFVRSYANGVASSSYEGDTRFLSGENTIDKLYFTTAGSSQTLSQIIVSDEPTTFARVYTLPLTADTPFDWEGTPTNITGTKFSTDEGALVSGTADDVALFTAQTMPAIDTDLYEIAAVVMSVNATTQETVDQNRLDFVAQGSGAVTEFGSPQVLDPEAFDHHLFIAETDFVNGGAWTVEKVNALKYGFKSKA